MKQEISNISVVDLTAFLKKSRGVNNTTGSGNMTPPGVKQTTGVET